MITLLIYQLANELDNERRGTAAENMISTRIQGVYQVTMTSHSTIPREGKKEWPYSLIFYSTVVYICMYVCTYAYIRARNVMT